MASFIYRLASFGHAVFKQLIHGIPLVTLSILITMGTPSFAQDELKLYLEPRFIPPEAVLIPIQSDGHSESRRWRLSYHNRLTGSETPDSLIETRVVLLNNDNGRPSFGIVSWKIVRTRNDQCVQATGSSCPDMIHVLTVPEGYLAIPDDAWVDEGDTLQILIVPNRIG